MLSASAACPASLGCTPSGQRSAPSWLIAVVSPGTRCRLTRWVSSCRSSRGTGRAAACAVGADRTIAEGFTGKQRTRQGSTAQPRRSRNHSVGRPPTESAPLRQDSPPTGGPPGRQHLLLRSVFISALFGLSHLHGTPSGVLGMTFAGLFGLTMCLVRETSRGAVLWVIAAHFVADVILIGGAYGLFVR